jgi:hypothetical protein
MDANTVVAWMQIVVLVLPIPIVELLFDDLTSWERAAMAAVAAVAVALAATMSVRLVRSNKRVALPSA